MPHHRFVCAANQRHRVSETLAERTLSWSASTIASMPEGVQALAERLASNVERVLVGKRGAIELAIVALLCEGHLLIEDVPGIGKTTLPRPFVVLATQNPVELEGTFPLPEAQLDRFLIRLGLGYPSFEDEDLLLERGPSKFESLAAVATPEEVLAAAAACAQVRVHDDV